MIARNKTFNPILSLSLPNPDDGKVRVESTKVNGMTDFIEVPHTHPFIMRSEEVIQQVIHFLQHGRFLRFSGTEVTTITPARCQHLPEMAISSHA